MPSLLTAAVAGVAAGLVASAVMEAYQNLASPLFGQKNEGDPATVQAADDAKAAVGQPPVTQKHRMLAGRAVHYATGLALGIGYGIAALYWPPITLWFGVAFGLAVSLVLDDVAVPAFGWGPPAWETPLNTHAYALSAHAVFGLVLEGVRRGTAALL